jgi:hypothetical protein
MALTSNESDFMNAIKSIFLASLAVVNATVASDAQDFRTDINPALRYYQAMILEPSLSPADHDYLFTNEWRGKMLPARFGDLVSNFDASFEMMNEAGKASVACDWGVDLIPGPQSLLPELARSKSLAKTAMLGVLWDLQNGQETEARDKLLGAYALGRNTSRDGTLIGVFVECALENIVLDSVAANYYSFSAETLQQLADGFDAAPAQGTMANAILTGERAIFHGWLDRKVRQLRQESPGDDAKVMARLRKLFESLADESGHTNQWDAVITSAGTSEGVLKYADDDELYQNAAKILALPRPEFEAQAQSFQAGVDRATNPLVALTFPGVIKARPKEFMAEALLGMFHAAVAYKLHGEEGFRSVNDPFGQGPFQFDRFSFEGVDRGFKVTSAYAGRGFPVTLIFVESPGVPFLCSGAKAGQPLSN